MWEGQSNACRMTESGAGCGDGEVCIATHPAPYDQPACIFKQGAEQCPTDWPTATAAFESGTDDRTCNECACEVSNAACVNAGFIIYDDDVCGTGGIGMVDIGTTCVNVQGYADNDEMSYRAVAATATADCVPSGGAPTGEVNPSGPLTFCCQ